MNTEHPETNFASPSNLLELIGLASEKFKNRPFIGAKDLTGRYQWTTYQEIYTRIKNFSSGLASLGVNKGDHVGIIMKNSAEWCISAFAAYGVGAIFTPINEREILKTCEQIICSSSMKVLILEDNDSYVKLFDIINQASFPIITIIAKSTGINSFSHIEELGEKNPRPFVSPQPSDTTNLIYTSGTSGRPKGVFSSHENIMSVVLALKNHFPHLNEQDRAFSIFPWSHVAGLVDELFFAIFLGASIAVMDRRQTLMEDLKTIKPTIIATAPILFNRFYDKIHQTIKEQGSLVEFLFKLAMIECSKKRETGKETFKYKILNNLIIQNIRDVFGGRLKMSVVGGAAMNEAISHFFIGLGIQIYNGYGLTETCGMLTFNSPSFPNKVKSVGKPLLNMSVVIDKNKTGENSPYGEIIAYGPNIALGYHDNHELNELTKTADGGFRTGDLGEIDKEGYLHIVGRLKEEYKLSNGKYIHPAKIEEEIKSNFYVTNAMVYGENQEYNVCLIVPNFDNLKGLTTRLNIYSPDHYEIIKERMAQEFLDTEIKNHLTNKFTNYEIPKKFLYIAEDFTLENGLLTNTLKLKRDKILEEYGYGLKMLYDTTADD